MPYDTYATASNADFTLNPAVPPETYATASNADFTPNPNVSVQMVVANPQLFTPAVEWNNGKARIVNTVQLNIGGGESAYYFIGGMPALTSLPTTYDFNPGDSISIILAIAQTPNGPYHWNRKAFVQLMLGTDPLPTYQPALPYRVTRPPWLAPTDIWVARGMKDAPTMSLPDNRIFTIVKKRTDITSESVVTLRRGGVLAVMDNDSPANQRINWSHSRDLAVPGAPPANTGDGYGGQNLTNNDIIKASNVIPCALFEANEFQEGLYGVPDFSPQYFQWYAARLKKYADPLGNPLGLPFRDFGTYGGNGNYNGDPWNYQVEGGGNKMPNDPVFKTKISSVDAARQTCSYFFPLAGLEAMGVGAIIKHYSDQPDYASRYYNKAFAAEVMAKGINDTPAGIAPAQLAYLDWGKVEGLGTENGSLHNGYYFTRNVGNLGTLKTDKHPQVDYDWQVGNIFGIAFCRTIGYIVFDERSQYDQFGTNPNEVKARDPDTSPSSWQWQPNGAGVPAPITSAGYPTEPCRWHDAGFEAAYYYSQCGRTEGTSWQYCRYQFKQSGIWVEPQTDGTTILEHASAFDGPYATDPTSRRGRPDAMFRIKDNAVDVWAFDPSRGKNSYETIILNPVPNVQIEVNLQGSKLALFNTVQFFF
ncbi:hypothetical protein EXU85_19895 [Spirosoma sp. KCTC 42546]|uniref:hypothetical protein n=1 Tax=Spirosoma sp. KCTC 42546 TaxID=2520506 RepID=UPI0011598DA7|nr:hypothetical protein [Spirosoma sp. KCTC 42546]QDK80744.1 hypothetical protein EXU85_19895 [Spirosoma sp. KCTC 42546]